MKGAILKAWVASPMALLAMCLGVLCLPLATSCLELRPSDVVGGGRDWARVITVDPKEGIYFDIESGHNFQQRDFFLAFRSAFSDGMCVAMSSPDGKKGYIDRSGRLVIPFQYDGVGNFHEGRALVFVGKAAGVIDKSGRWVLEPGRYDLYGFCEGRCAFEKGGRWGFLDEGGNVVIPPVYQAADISTVPIFSEGLCRVKDEAGDEVYIDRGGRVRIRLPNAEWSGCSFREGLARVQRKFSSLDGGPLDWGSIRSGFFYGFMSKDGRIVIEPRFGSAGYFSEGLAAVTITDDGLLSDSGEIIDEWNPDPEEPEPPPAWGFINQKGEVVIPLVYQKAKHFREGLAPVKQRGKWGYIDHHGRMVIGAGFEEAKEFKNGIAEVAIGKKVVYIDKQGQILVRTKMSSIRF